MSVRIGVTRRARVFNGAHIRKVRKFDRRYTLKYLADKCGCTEQAISQYERGERSMDVYTCKCILNALKCTPYDVLCKVDQEKMIAEFSEDAFVYADAEPTPVKIKKGLEHCCEAGCKHCPYEDDCHLSDGGSELAADALAYIRQLEAQVGTGKNVPTWISTKERLPETGDVVLVIASGNPRPNVELRDAYLIASYWADEGWVADGYDGWDALDVSCWMPLPEPPKEE